MINFTRVKSDKELNAILADLIKTEELTRPEGVFIGTITDVTVKDGLTKDKQKFEVICLHITLATSNKKMVKEYSVDFTRKILAQFELKATDMIGINCVCKQGDYYKKIGWINYIELDEEGVYVLRSYKDDATDYSSKLAKLGL